jgi:tetratricopeptide (TPR) repeat protein
MVQDCSTAFRLFGAVFTTISEHFRLVSIDFSGLPVVSSRQGDLRMSKSILHGFSLLLLAVAGKADQDALVTRVRDASKLEDMGNYVAAERLLRTTVKELEDSSSADPLLAVALNNLGSIYQLQERYKDAAQCLRKAIEIDRGADVFVTARYIINLAQVYLDTAQYGKAERLDLRALEARLAASEPDSPEVARLLITIGVLAAGQHRYDEAETAYKKALAIQETRPDGDETFLALNNLAILYHYMGRDPEALACGERTLRLADRILSENDPRLAKLLLSIGVLQQLVKGPEAADPFYRRALSVGERAFGTDHPFIGELLTTYATALRRMNRRAEAGKYARRAKVILRSTPEAAIPKYTIDVADLRHQR